MTILELGRIASAHDTEIAHAMLHAVAVATARGRDGSPRRLLPLVRDAPRARRRDVQAVRSRCEAPAQAGEEGVAAPPARGQGARVVGH